jgi:hypothetical protein
LLRVSGGGEEAGREGEGREDLGLAKHWI